MLCGNSQSGPGNRVSSRATGMSQGRGSWPPRGAPSGRGCWNCGRGHFARDCWRAPALPYQFQWPPFPPQYPRFLGPKSKIQYGQSQNRGSDPRWQRGGRNFGQSFGRGFGRGATMYMDLGSAEYPSLPTDTSGPPQPLSPAVSQSTRQQQNLFSEAQMTYLQQLLAPPNENPH